MKAVSVKKIEKKDVVKNIKARIVKKPVASMTPGENMGARCN